MDVLDLLGSDHREIQGFVSEYNGLAPHAIHSKQVVSARLFAALDRHARLEEEIFYPELETSAETADAIRNARREHEEITLLVRALRETSFEDPQFEPRMKALEEMLTEHIAEEEEEIFPAALDLLGSERLTVIAERAEAMQAEWEAPVGEEEPPIPPVTRL